MRNVNDLRKYANTARESELYRLLKRAFDAEVNNIVNGVYNVYSQNSLIYQSVVKHAIVSRQQLDDFGFAYNFDSWVDLNRVLNKYGITSSANVTTFMATVGLESGKGTKILEEGNGEYFNAHGYTTNTRGAGHGLEKH